MKIRATQAILECLLEQGVDTVFGYPGGTILNLYDELYDYRDRIRHILTSHEQGAAHAADGYARSTGKTGVCFATSGPGATRRIWIRLPWYLLLVTSARVYWAATPFRKWILQESPCRLQRRLF